MPPPDESQLERLIQNATARAGVIQRMSCVIMLNPRDGKSGLRSVNSSMLPEWNESEQMNRPGYENRESLYLITIKWTNA
jgi:hypothetical protein